MTLVVQIVGLLVKFGPDVLKLISELCSDIYSSGASKDRKAAERVLYKRAWEIKNNVPPQPKV